MEPTDSANNHILASQWREQWTGALHSPEDLARFIDYVGCCTWKEFPKYPNFPFQNAVMGAVDPNGSDTWFWKDDLHIEKRIYYSRIFGGQWGYISYALLPAFIATNGEVADELLYYGSMSQDMQQIYHAIEANGPISTRNLKKLLTLDAKSSSNRLLIDLECKFIITKVGITGRTLATYSYVWDLVERWIPEMLVAADDLGRKQAEVLLKKHLQTFGILPDSPFYAKVLGWTV
jgi:hypothetical protein